MCSGLHLGWEFETLHCGSLGLLHVLIISPVSQIMMWILLVTYQGCSLVWFRWPDIVNLPPQHTNKPNPPPCAQHAHAHHVYVGLSVNSVFCLQGLLFNHRWNYYKNLASLYNCNSINLLRISCISKTNCLMQVKLHSASSFSVQNQNSSLFYHGATVAQVEGLVSCLFEPLLYPSHSLCPRTLCSSCLLVVVRGPVALITWQM